MGAMPVGIKRGDRANNAKNRRIIYANGWCGNLAAT
jgi:hypothetical protein